MDWWVKLLGKTGVLDDKFLIMHGHAWVRRQYHGMAIGIDIHKSIREEILKWIIDSDSW